MRKQNTNDISYEETFAAIKRTMETLKEDILPQEQEDIETMIEQMKISGSLGRMQHLSDITHLCMKIGMRANKNRLNRLSGGKY